MGKKRFGVIFGGTSTEHEVSIVSGTSVIKNLNKEKYEIYPIYIDKAGEWFEFEPDNKTYKVGDEIVGTKKIENIWNYLKTMDILFPVLHGLQGEDGTIQGMFELLKIPYLSLIHILIGYAKAKNAPAIGKSIVKANPEEKVGVFCKRNGKPSVVEYTEITKEMAEERDQTGELVFGESHINCNLFNIKSIEKIGDEKLPYHTAFKKATYMDENGEIIKPEEPNCYKFETFIFDSFLKLDNMEILRGKREEEFAPVKNKEGEMCIRDRGKEEFLLQFL